MEGIKCAEGTLLGTTTTRRMMTKMCMFEELLYKAKIHKNPNSYRPGGHDSSLFILAQENGPPNLT